jgi:hypothetical protein
MVSSLSGMRAVRGFGEVRVIRVPCRLGTSILGKPHAPLPEFEFKLGVNTPDTHPLTLRLTEAAHAIGAQSSGRLNVTVFPNSRLGGDPRNAVAASRRRNRMADAIGKAAERYTGRLTPVS